MKKSWYSCACVYNRELKRENSSFLLIWKIFCVSVVYMNFLCSFEELLFYPVLLSDYQLINVSFSGDESFYLLVCGLIMVLQMEVCIASPHQWYRVAYCLYLWYVTSYALGIVSNVRETPRDLLELEIRLPETI